MNAHASVPRHALITGAAGQDGTILAAQLSRGGDHVSAVVKPGTDISQFQKYCPGASIIECDLGDTQTLADLIVEAAPDEIYNLGGFTAPGESWHHQEEVRRINVDAVAAMLSAIPSLPRVHFFQASSASIFEGADAIPQTERTRHAPKTPYAFSKNDAMALVDEARSNGIFATSGILYNHESPLRGPNFVTRRITMAVARIAKGLQDTVELGDVEVARDWGWAPDYTRAMTLMLRAEVPHDYVLATGISHRLSFFLARAFAAAGISDWRKHVITSQDRVRGTDTNMMVGDSRAAYTELGWRHTVDFDSMAAIMVQHDLALIEDPTALWTGF